MDRQAAERYHAQRMRRLAERRARQEEWDFAATTLAETEIADAVGSGWRPLVLNLHRQLLELDPSYRLYSVGEELGGLSFIARTEATVSARAARLIQAARAEALTTCEVCGDSGHLRAERPNMRTLCDECWQGDRQAAAERGERYADAALAFVLSNDDDYPSPEETLAWLDAFDD